MSASEWVVVLVCVMLGYGVVSWLMGGGKTRGDDPSLRSSAPPPDDAPIDRPSSARSGDPAWALVLGVPPVASIDDIRSAYRHLMSQYHPDKVANLGPELRELAERKSKEISTAYATAMQQRGAD